MAQSTPTFAQALQACATMANMPQCDAGNSAHHSLVYAYLNAPGHINVKAKNQLLAVAHLPCGHPVYVILHALHHAVYGGTPATTAQLVSYWYQSDN